MGIADAGTEQGGLCGSDGWRVGDGAEGPVGDGILYSVYTQLLHIYTCTLNTEH